MSWRLGFYEVWERSVGFGDFDLLNFEVGVWFCVVLVQIGGFNLGRKIGYSRFRFNQKVREYLIVHWLYNIFPRSLNFSLKNPKTNFSGILVVSGTTQPILRLLTSSTGHIKWETPLASIPSYSSPFTPKIVLERLKVGGDIVGIQDGLKVFRVGGEDGLIKWEWDASSVGLVNLPSPLLAGSSESQYIDQTKSS